MALFIAFLCATAVGALSFWYFMVARKTKPERIREKAVRAGCVAKGIAVGSKTVYSHWTASEARDSGMGPEVMDDTVMVTYRYQAGGEERTVTRGI